jgi:hypothetical protein
MSDNPVLWENLDKLTEIANERCSEELQCRHCYASQYLNDLYQLTHKWLNTINTDCEKKDFKTNSQ